MKKLYDLIVVNNKEKRIMKKEIVKQETGTELTTAQELNAWGVQEISSQDILIPKILCMQGLSQFVADGNAQIGEFRDSVNGTLLGSISNPIKFIPVHIDKVWVLSKKTGDRYKFSHMEPVTRENENFAWDFTDEQGELWRRDYTMNCYCILPIDVDHGMPMPYTISFRRTSLRAGKKLFTQMYVRNRQAGKVPPAMVMQLSGKREKNDLGTFIVLDCEMHSASNQDEIAAAFDLYKTIQGGNVRVDHSDLEAEAEKVKSDRPLSNQF